MGRFNINVVGSPEKKLDSRPSKQHTTDINSNNKSTNNVINSPNDNSSGISDCDGEMPSMLGGKMPSMLGGDMPSMLPRSAGYREEDYTQLGPQPHLPRYSPPQIPSTGGTVTNLFNLIPPSTFNEHNNTLRDPYNDNSLVDSTGKHSADDHSIRVDEKSLLAENNEQIPTVAASAKLPEQGTKIDSASASDIVHSDNSEHSCTTSWIVAEHALQHARNNISSISKVFDKWRIQNSEYVVLAGFDESLIKSGIGYLEQIHVYVMMEIAATSPLLSELGRLFSPFSSTLFTESSSYRLPVFKDNGSVWEFDELVYFTASKFSDGGSSAKTPLTIISLSQTPSSLADGMTGFSQSSSGSGEGEKNKEQRLDKGKERDAGDKEEGDKHDEDPSDDPEDPPEVREGIIAGPVEISFQITSEIYPIQDKRNTFQTLTMHGSLTIETTPLVQNPPQFSERFVQFKELTLTTIPPIDNAYKQFHLRVDVNSHQENARITYFKPTTTSDSDGEEMQFSSLKSGWTHGMVASLTLGPHPQAAVTGSAMKTNVEAGGFERKRYNSAITEHHIDGKIQWGFNIDDINFQKRGINMPKDVLPTARFKFLGDSNVPAPPEPPPKCMDIVITSYWSMILPHEQKSTWIHKLLRFFKLTDNTRTISYSNLFQIVALTADVANLPELSYYRAKVKVESGLGVSEPPEVKRQVADSVYVTPAVVDDLEKLSKFNLPSNAKFKLSDICIPVLENCNSKRQ